MITLFRRIREKLIKQGDLQRYLLYAIGEIALVMIGILLALQVNSIQIEKENQRTEIKVLKKLQQDLKKDEMDLLRLVEVKETQRNSSLYVLDYFEDPTQPIRDTVSHVYNMRHPFGFYVDNPHRVAFSTSMNSGELFLIRNEDLLDLLSFYFADNNLSQFLLTIKDFSTYYSFQVFMEKYAIPTPENYDVNKMRPYWDDHQMKNYYTSMGNAQLPISIELIRKKISVNRNLQTLIDHELGKSLISASEWDSIYQNIVDANSTY